LKLVDFGLVKLAAPGEITITILQGRGTALYTPLEQYGGDSGHTDARSDIYSFGATLYHLLTNQPPVDARERFLHPEAMIMPRQLNPAVSMRVERAILWAMGLHPDDRPQTVEDFRQALLGDYIPSTRTQFIRPVVSLRAFLSRPPERTLFLITLFLTAVTLFFTLFK
jgi:serine/threonine-protein kinase